VSTFQKPKMLSLPSQLNFFNITINTFGIFIFLGFLFLAFIVWKEGKKDGFDEERLFDILLTASFLSVLFSRVFYAFGNSITASAFFNQVIKIWTVGFDPLGALIGFLLPVLIFSKLWKWSFYRIADIFSMGFALAFSIVTLGFVGLQANFNFLFAFACWIFVFALLSKIRGNKFRSGYGFCLFLLLNAGLGWYFFGAGEYLIFYVSLVTLGFIVFLFRWRIANVSTTSRFIK